MGVHVDVPSGAIRIAPGDVVDQPFTVHNTGCGTDRFTFEVTGSSSTWTTVEPPVMELRAGSGAAARLRFHPPRVAHVRAGEVPFGVLAVSAGTATCRMVEGLLLVASFDDTRVELDPPVQEGRRASYRLQVHNGGNTLLHLTVRADCDDADVSLRCRPGTLSLHPGEVRSCRVDVRVPRAAANRSPNGHVFRVIAQPVGRDPIVVGGLLLPPRR